VLEAQAHPFDLIAQVDAREVESHRPVHRVLDRAGEDFAVGEVLLAVRALPGPPAEREGEVNAGASDFGVLLVAQPVHQARLLVAEGMPVGDRIGLVEAARLVDEFLVVEQAHLRCLSLRLCRPADDRPA